MDWNLEIEPKLLELLKKRDDSLMLRGSLKHGCCGGKVTMPVAEFGAPGDTANWDVIERQGVQVFVDRDLIIPFGSDLRVGVQSLLRWHKLWVDGLEPMM